MSEENQSGFKVTDRRLFKPDGTMREDLPAQEERQEFPPAVALPTSPAPAQERSIAPDGYLDQDDPNAMPEQTMFTEFLMGIASSAFIYLGLVEHPATGKRQVDLMAAKESIDMLSMLRDKTRGNLTSGEERFFEEILSDLRMQFVTMRKQ